MKDRITQLIYTYLTSYVNDKEVKALWEALREYTVNGSFEDYIELNCMLEDLDEVLQQSKEIPERTDNNE